MRKNAWSSGPSTNVADIASIALQTPGLVSRSDWPRPADEDRRSQKKINKKTSGIGSKSKHQAQGSTKVESQPQAKEEERDVSIGLHEPDDGKKVTQCECRISNGHDLFYQVVQTKTMDVLCKEEMRRRLHKIKCYR